MMKVTSYLKNTIKYIIRSYPIISSYVNEVEKRYSMTVEKSRSLDEERFVDLFRKTYDKSTFYRELYADKGIGKNDIQCLADIEKLPIITKDDVRKHADKILIEPRWKVMKAFTSGTTGASIHIFQGLDSILTEQAYLYCYRKKCGFTYGENLVSMRGHLDSKTFRMKLPVGNILYLSSYQIKKENVYRYQDEILAHKPKAIEGYPSSIYNLCCLFKEFGIKINIPLCFTSSETLFDYQRKLFREVLGCETFDWYGCTEKTIALVETIEHDGYYELPGYSINEYKEDCVLTTSLINDSFPLIRYKVNDIVEPKVPYELHYITDPVVDKLEGRTESYIITKSGTIIGRLNFLFKDVDNIKLAQIVQAEPGRILINIIPDGPFNDVQIKHIREYIDERIGLSQIDCEVRIVTDEEIIYTSRNKFNQVVRLF